jgi:phage/plasmid-associated DNA primase
MGDRSDDWCEPQSSVFNKLDAQLDNTVQLKTNSTYNELQSFLQKYKIQKSTNGNNNNKHSVSNIIDQGRKISYDIPNLLIPEFFRLLELCRKQRMVLNFSEKQIEPSGIMLDFDIKQAGEKCQVSDDHCYSLVTRLVDVIIKCLVPCDVKYDIYIMVLKKIKTEYREENNEKYFKDGFHILIPGIKVSKGFKRYLIKLIQETKLLDSIFDDIKINGEISDMLDTNSSHVVTLFPGNCKSGGTPYAIDKIYSTSIKNSKITCVSQCNNDFEHKLNITYDFSVNWERLNSPVVKREFLVLESINDIINSSSKPAPTESSKIENDLSILGVHDPDSTQLKNIIDILDVSRCEEYKEWFSIVCALAYLGNKYKPLALYFSGKRAKGVRDEFETVWERAITSEKKYNFSKDMIENYARIDNPEEYRKIMNGSIFAILTEAIFDKKIGGYVDHWQIASLLKAMLPNKYIVDYNESTNSLNWYEFVLQDDPHIPGEIYKWRCCKDPYTLSKYISMKIPIVFDRAIEYLNERKTKAIDEDQVKYYNTLIKIVVQSSRKLFNHGFKLGVMKESESLFRQVNFARQLDKDENTMGVGNGVLLFDKVPILIESHNPYNVSRYTSVKYKKLNPLDSLTIEVYKSIIDLFPDDELDAFHYILFFLCTSLTGRMKACIFLTLRGNGANGKSYMMELIRNLLGGVMDGGYGCKLPIQFLIEKDQLSNNASPVLVPLKWARLTYFSESDKSEHLKVSKVKMLTGHEPLTIRALYGNQENIVSRSNYLVGTNYELKNDSTDHGTWRRLQEYVMKIKFCKNPSNKYEKMDDPTFSTKKAQDPDFLSCMLGILTMYLGILDMKYKGDINLVPCPTVKRETEIFRNRQDVINKFLTERVVITPDPDYTMTTDYLTDAYCHWYDINVKEKRHDRADINMMFRNSKIGDRIIKKINGTDKIKGLRVLGADEEKDDTEIYMSDNIRVAENIENRVENEVVNGIEFEPAIDRKAFASGVLNEMYAEYVSLIEENNIDYW